MDIQKGDFVHMHRTGISEWWCEVIQVMPMVDRDGKPFKEQQYQVRYWSNRKNQWDYFHLAPDTYHEGMVKEILRLDPSVADIFRATNIKKG